MLNTWSTGKMLQKPVSAKRPLPNKDCRLRNTWLLRLLFNQMSSMWLGEEV